MPLASVVVVCDQRVAAVDRAVVVLVDVELDRDVGQAAARRRPARRCCSRPARRCRRCWRCRAGAGRSRLSLSPAVVAVTRQRGGRGRRIAGRDGARRQGHVVAGAVGQAVDAIGADGVGGVAHGRAAAGGRGADFDARQARLAGILHAVAVHVGPHAVADAGGEARCPPRCWGSTPRAQRSAAGRPRPRSRCRWSGCPGPPSRWRPAVSLSRSHSLLVSPVAAW